MKKLFMILPLVFLLCFTFSCQQGEEVREWVEADVEADVEAEKEAVADFFQACVDTAVEGDIEKLKSFYHPEMSWWDYKQEQRVGIETYLKSMEEFYKSGLKWICDLESFEIHIVGDTAVLYTTYANKFIDPEGNETTESGPWTAVLIKQDDKWLFLSNSWTAK